MLPLKKYSYIITAIFFATVLTANAEAPNTSKETIRPIVVDQKNPSFTIDLPATAGTGYQWYLVHYNHRLLQPINHSYTDKQSSDKVGSPGVSEWKFTAKDAAFQVPQTTKVKFEYRRSWENKPGQKQSILVVFNPSKS